MQRLEGEERDKFAQMKLLYTQTKRLERTHQDEAYTFDEKKLQDQALVSDQMSAQVSRRSSQDSHVIGQKGPTAAPLPDTILSEADDEDEQSDEERDSDGERGPHERAAKGQRIDTLLVFQRRGIEDASLPAHHLNYRQYFISPDKFF